MHDCIHLWQKIHEEFVLGGSFPVGYQCKNCGKYVSISDVPISGLGGKDSGEQVLRGPHGCAGHTSDGKSYKRQTIYRDGRLEIER